MAEFRTKLKKNKNGTRGIDVGHYKLTGMFSVLDPSQVLQPSEGTWCGQKKKQLHF